MSRLKMPHDEAKKLLRQVLKNPKSSADTLNRAIETANAAGVSKQEIYAMASQHGPIDAQRMKQSNSANGALRELNKALIVGGNEMKRNNPQVPPMAHNGSIPDLNDPTNRDTVHAKLTPGEFVLNKEASAMFGPMIEQMNHAGLQQRVAENNQMMNRGPIPHPGEVPGYSLGGWVGNLVGQAFLSNLMADEEEPRGFNPAAPIPKPRSPEAVKTVEHASENLQANRGPDQSSYNLFGGPGWELYKDTVGNIESKNTYDIKGGYNDHYDGRWQLGAAAKKDAARILGIDVPSREEFRKNPELQDKMFRAYTQMNHKVLSNNSSAYRDMSPQEQQRVLGYAHNQGAGGALDWMKTGQSKEDGFGTNATKYSQALAAAQGNPGVYSGRGRGPTEEEINLQRTGQEKVYERSNASKWAGERDDGSARFPDWANAWNRWQDREPVASDAIPPTVPPIVQPASIPHYTGEPQGVNGLSSAQLAQAGKEMTADMTAFNPVTPNIPLPGSDEAILQGSSDGQAKAAQSQDVMSQVHQRLSEFGVEPNPANVNAYMELRKSMDHASAMRTLTGQATPQHRNPQTGFGGADAYAAEAINSLPENYVDPRTGQTKAQMLGAVQKGYQGPGGFDLGVGAGPTAGTFTDRLDVPPVPASGVPNYGPSTDPQVGSQVAPQLVSIDPYTGEATFSDGHVIPNASENQITAYTTDQSEGVPLPGPGEGLEGGSLWTDAEGNPRGTEPTEEERILEHYNKAWDAMPLEALYKERGIITDPTQKAQLEAIISAKEVAQARDNQNITKSLDEDGNVIEGEPTFADENVGKASEVEQKVNAIVDKHSEKNGIPTEEEMKDLQKRIDFANTFDISTNEKGEKVYNYDGVEYTSMEEAKAAKEKIDKGWTLTKDGKWTDGTWIYDNDGNKTNKITTSIVKDTEALADKEGKDKKEVVKERTEAEEFLRDIFKDVFGTKDIGKALAKGLVLYLGARLAGSSGGGALKWAAEFMMKEGEKKNKQADADYKTAKDLVTTNPNLYTPESQAEFLKTKDPDVLKRNEGYTPHTQVTGNLTQDEDGTVYNTKTGEVLSEDDYFIDVAEDGSITATKSDPINDVVQLDDEGKPYIGPLKMPTQSTAGLEKDVSKPSSIYYLDKGNGNIVPITVSTYTDNGLLGATSDDKDYLIATVDGKTYSFSQLQETFGTNVMTKSDYDKLAKSATDAQSDTVEAIKKAADDSVGTIKHLYDSAVIKPSTKDGNQKPGWAPHISPENTSDYLFPMMLKEGFDPNNPQHVAEWNKLNKRAYSDYINWVNYRDKEGNFPNRGSQFDDYGVFLKNAQMKSFGSSLNDKLAPLLPKGGTTEALGANADMFDVIADYANDPAYIEAMPNKGNQARRKEILAIFIQDWNKGDVDKEHWNKLAIDNPGHTGFTLWLTSQQ